MKFSCAYTDPDGLTVSLSVSGFASFSSPGSSTAELQFSASDLAETFENCLPGITSRLLQAHQAIVGDLYAASVDHLKRLPGFTIIPVDKDV